MCGVLPYCTGFCTNSLEHNALMHYNLYIFIHCCFCLINLVRTNCIWKFLFGIIDLWNKLNFLNLFKNKSKGIRRIFLLLLLYNECKWDANNIAANHYIRTTKLRRLMWSKCVQTACDRKSNIKNIVLMLERSRIHTNFLTFR